MSLPNGEVIYQAYPLSFADGNRDGVGDFAGIRQRLPYLKELGVENLWLTPFYESPWKDGGYDVADYIKVNERLHGSQAEALGMFAVANAMDIKIIADFVPSHSSDQHPLFQAALQGIETDHYIFRDSKDGGPPNNWLSVFPGRDKAGNMTPESAWREVAKYWPHAHPSMLGKLALTSFAAYQPNWNHANPKVDQKLKAAMRYWLRNGISGFRVDAVDFMDHNRDYTDEPQNIYYRPGDPPYDTLMRKNSVRGPNAKKYLKELLSVLDEFSDAFAMLESYPDRDAPNDDPVEHYMRFYREFGEHWPGRVAPFCFEITDLPWDAKLFKNAIDRFQAALRPQDVPIYPGGNHDKDRIASRYGEQQARAAALLLALPGISVIYMGDELGMTNHTGIPRHKLTDTYLNRDVARSPLPMHARDPSAGFSMASVEDFALPIHPNYNIFNVESQMRDPNSTLNLYIEAIRLKRENPILRYGDYQPIELDQQQVFAFARTSENGNLLNFTNFSDQEIKIDMGHLATVGEVKLSSANTADKRFYITDLNLGPNESVIVQPIA